MKKASGWYTSNSHNALSRNSFYIYIYISLIFYSYLSCGLQYRCWIMFQSQDVARAIYFTPWYRFQYQLKRSLNIITMRSQKPAQLTAGYIVPLSLQTFASVRTLHASSVE